MQRSGTYAGLKQPENASAPHFSSGKRNATATCHFALILQQWTPYHGALIKTLELRMAWFLDDSLLGTSIKETASDQTPAVCQR